MTTMTMTFVVSQRFTNLMRGRGQSMLHARRRLSGRLSAAVNLSIQERANAYVARMPIAVIASSR